MKRLIGGGLAALGIGPLAGSTCGLDGYSIGVDGWPRLGCLRRWPRHLRYTKLVL